MPMLTTTWQPPQKHHRKATILHVDADAFFASVEQLLEPSYRGKPLVVGGRDRGVVCSASYEARRYGIHSAMPIYKARQLCPEAIFVRGNSAVYREISQRMFAIFHDYTPTVEITSIDEGYLDLSGTEMMHKADLSTIAMRILQRVEKEIGITISGALSTSKLVSKISTSQFKPRKLTLIAPGKERAFLSGLPLKSMPGIGKRSLPQFEYLGLKTLGDLAAMTFEEIWNRFGAGGIVLWERAQGIDRRCVNPEGYRRKSISEEKTFTMDISSQYFLEQETMKMLKDLCYQLRKRELYAKTILLKIRYSSFQTYTHQKTLESVSNDEDDFRPLLKELLKCRQLDKKVRLIGVGLKNIQSELQLQLFPSTQSGGKRKPESLQLALDRIRKTHGANVI
jgi:DNA polymerase-4